MFKPLNERVLVEPEETAKETDFGLLLPDSQQEKPVTGIVSVGGKLVATGDRILFSKFGYDEVVIDKTTYYVVSEAAILGIFQ